MKLVPAPGWAKSSKSIFLHLIRRVSNHPLLGLLSAEQLVLTICSHSSAFLHLDTSKFHHFSFWLFAAMLWAHRVAAFALPDIPMFPWLLLVSSAAFCHHNSKLYSRARQGWAMNADNISVYILGDSADSLKTSGCLWSVFSNASGIVVSALH